jgi:hypothetical protein
MTFNATNPATDYKNGDDFIWDWASARNLQMALKSELLAMPINS